jgi:hypothetical protein
MRNVIVASLAFAATIVALPVMAAPLLPSNPAADVASPVTQVQGYRYHKSCYWTGGGWGYKQHGKVLVCRPHKPRGHGWYWHSHGGKHGWHHKRHGWHHKW